MSATAVATAQDCKPNDLLKVATKQPRPYGKFAAILLNGQSLVNKDTPDGKLMLAPDASGRMSVSAIDRSGAEPKATKPLQFKVAIRVWRRNSLYMYSDKTYSDIDLKEVIDKCEMGDSIILILFDEDYHLPRHEIVIGVDGC